MGAENTPLQAESTHMHLGTITPQLLKGSVSTQRDGLSSPVLARTVFVAGGAGGHGVLDHERRLGRSDGGDLPGNPGDEDADRAVQRWTKKRNKEKHDGAKEELSTSLSCH